MINKDYNLYIHQEKVMIIITPMDINGNISFSCEGDSLIVNNEKNNYILMCLGKINMDLLKNKKGFLVEIGNTRIIAEYEIKF